VVDVYVPGEQYVVTQYKQYIAGLQSKRVILRHKDNPAHYKVTSPADVSRYTERGRWRIQQKIRRRLGNSWNMPGVMVTLTYDPKLTSIATAWRDVGKHRREFANKLNLYWRRATGAKRALGYVSVVEVQPSTGYPHVHMVFPGLKFLAPCQRLTTMWSRGMTDVRYRDNVSPTSYICKYIGKLKGWDEKYLAILRFCRLRLYSISLRYYLPALKDGVVGEWRYFMSTVAANMEWFVDTTRAQGGRLCLACSP
jgi:hypothetical protein